METTQKRTVSEEGRRKLSIAHIGKPQPWKLGENNPAWKGGVTKERDRVKGSLEYKNWRRGVLERDGHSCQKCGSSDKLHAHHIKNKKDFPDLIFDVSNGQTLCRNCHGSEHGILYSDNPSNKCPDCGKKIKRSAKRCSPCSILFTAKRKEKFCSCGNPIKTDFSNNCRSCAAKLRCETIKPFKRK